MSAIHSEPTANDQRRKAGDEIMSDEWEYQDWMHSSEGLPDFEENARKKKLAEGKIFCIVCEDWIDRSELKRWTGDDALHYLCPGCDSDLLPVQSLE